MWIKTYILTIITVVIFSSMAENIMPDTNMKKHISLAVGILVLLAIAKPIVSISQFSFDNIILNSDKVITTSEELSKKIYNEQSIDIQTSFENKTSEVITSDVNDFFKTKYNVDINVHDNRTVAKINCEPNIEIEKYIEDKYGFKCVFNKGGE